MLSVKIRGALMASAPSIEAIEERWAKSGDECDYFFSFFSCNRNFYSLNVRYVMPSNSWYVIDRGVFCKNEVYLSPFARTKGRLRKVDETRIGKGAGPRVVSDGRERVWHYYPLQQWRVELPHQEPGCGSAGGRLRRRREPARCLWVIGFPATWTTRVQRDKRRSKFRNDRVRHHWCGRLPA